MYQLLLGLYILVCFLLVVVILMQSGRGGGLVESFSAAETLFGGKTNIYMVRITMVLGALFLLLALGLNYFVVQRSKSVMERLFKRRPVSHAPIKPVSRKISHPAGKVKSSPASSPNATSKEKVEKVSPVKATSSEISSKREVSKEKRSEKKIPMKDVSVKKQAKENSVSKSSEDTAVNNSSSSQSATREQTK